MTLRVLSALSLLAVVCMGQQAFASDKTEKKEISIEIKDHQFTPSEVKVPVGEPFILHVKNNDASAEEFESKPLKIEKVIAGNKDAKIHVRALEKGSYPFVGEFHEDVAKGTLIAE
jgi:plastocyanin